LKANDPTYLKLLKLDILLDITTPGSGKEVIDELGYIAMETDQSVATKAVEVNDGVSLFPPHFV